MIDEVYESLGGDSILRTILDFEEGTRTEEIVDVNVVEKRKFGREPPKRHVRPRTDSGPSQTLIPPTPPAFLSNLNQSTWRKIPDEDMADIQILPAPPRQSKVQPNTTDSGETDRKYHLISELDKNVKTDQIGEKIMNTPIQLSIREILAVSGEIADYLHDQTRKRRIPIEDRPAATAPAPAPTAVQATTAASSISSINVNSVNTKSYYTLPSDHTKITLDDQLSMNATLDNESEVNMMPKHMFERMNLPIDTEIHWRINAYNIDSGLEAAGSIDVCHDIPINLGGIEVKQHIFVMEYSNADLILGRSWERAVRASYINEDDDSYIIHIKSQDDRREVQFCAVRGQHERNQGICAVP